MIVQEALQKRANEKCEICEASSSLSVFAVFPYDDTDVDRAILICEKCHSQMGEDDLDVNHWRCLNSSMWSEVPAVQVVAWRMLNRLADEDWARDLLQMMYLDEERLAWAREGLQEIDSTHSTRDSNGTKLSEGDTVTLIKDLDVKGGGFTAKRGTTVKNISLTDNPEQIEGRVNGVRIVLLTKFLKKL